MLVSITGRKVFPLISVIKVTVRSRVATFSQVIST